MDTDVKTIATQSAFTVGVNLANLCSSEFPCGSSSASADPRLRGRLESRATLLILILIIPPTT
jgi:hypothetical protein